jgi:hypothetical protein
MKTTSGKGLALGLAVGVGIGVALGNLAVGIGIGAALGLTVWNKVGLAKTCRTKEAGTPGD